MGLVRTNSTVLANQLGGQRKPRVPFVGPASLRSEGSIERLTMRLYIKKASSDAHSGPPPVSILPAGIAQGKQKYMQ